MDPHSLAVGFALGMLASIVLAVPLVRNTLRQWATTDRD